MSALLVGCGGVAPSPPQPTSVSPSAIATDGKPTVYPLGTPNSSSSVTASDGGRAAATPTDSTIQVVNLYDPGDEAPFALDIYALRGPLPGQILFTYPLPSDQPVGHAEFGAATAPFDPGSLDGEEAWAAFRAGVAPNDASLVWFGGRSLTPGGRYTDTVSSKRTGGAEARHLVADVGYDNEANPYINPWTPSPDSTSLFVGAPGLDAIWGSTSGQAVYVQVGDKCLEEDAIPGAPAAVTPGSTLKLDNVPTGEQQITAFANDFHSHPGCVGTVTSRPLTAAIPANGWAWLFIYSTSPNEVGAVFVPSLE